MQISLAPMLRIWSSTIILCGLYAPHIGTVCRLVFIFFGMQLRAIHFVSMDVSIDKATK